MAIGFLLITRRVRRTAARAAAGGTVFFEVGANLPGTGRRYSLGRVRSGGDFRWEPRWSWTLLRELPADLRHVRTRETAFREMLWPPGRRRAGAGPERW
ncbi:hypothetical protein [Streptomyces sp. H51]|uniref:hypothetical protein n=1 Tax=Streptomyces sp. H51 TaxID=3111770 RepID=UPI002D78243D|nr:hypothetical protein [Streptomyces sp. H51]